MEVLLVLILIALVALIVLTLLYKRRPDDLSARFDAALKEQFLAFQSDIHKELSTTRQEVVHSKDLISQHTIKTIENIKEMSATIHKINLNLPIFGAVIKKINLARFSLTLSSLLKSTIPIIQAVEITSETCSNITYKQALKGAVENIKTGQPLSEVLATHDKLFPPMVTEMVMVGERSGEVDRLLQELSEFYGEEVDKTMKNFSTIIEPVIILLLGGAVAGLAVAVIMPIYSLVNNF